MTGTKPAPVTLYGSSISYFTGKMETYFRVRGIAYRNQAMNRALMTRAERETGVMQLPSVELADGRWMTDTTRMIQWFEQAVPANPLIPRDPLQRFFSLLLEDYADEWLWRPAMHFRWYQDDSAHMRSRHLASELTRDVPLPAGLKRWFMRQRQRRGYTLGDGIHPGNVAAVEAVYHRCNAQLEAIFNQRPFLLGDAPSLADIGFSGPYFRHFSQDPVPGEILRQQAPAVHAWLGRLWAWGGRATGNWLSGIPQDWGPILDDIGSHYLPYLCANAEAVAAGRKRFDAAIAGVEYRGARYSKYRVWCLQQLRDEFAALPPPARVAGRELLETHGIWEPLWRLPVLDACARQNQGLPFHADNKMIGVN